MKNLEIDIVSDVMCPWCIIGYKRLEKALDSISDQVSATIHFHSFIMNPNVPEEGCIFCASTGNDLVCNMKYHSS